MGSAAHRILAAQKVKDRITENRCGCGACGVCAIWQRRETRRIYDRDRKRVNYVSSKLKWEMEMDWRALELERGFPIPDTRGEVIPLEQSHHAYPRAIIDRRG